MRSRLVTVLIISTLLSFSSCNDKIKLKENYNENTNEYNKNLELSPYYSLGDNIYSTVIVQEQEFYKEILDNPIDNKNEWINYTESSLRIEQAVKYQKMWMSEIEYKIATLKNYLSEDDYDKLVQSYESWIQYSESLTSIEQEIYYVGSQYKTGSNDTYPLVAEAVAERTREYAISLMSLEFSLTGTVEFSTEKDDNR